jgi:hypothetical protein
VIRGVSPGTCTVSAGSTFAGSDDDAKELAWLVPQTRAGVDVVEDAATTVDFALETAAIVWVEVVDAAGAPAEGQWVNLRTLASDGAKPPEWSPSDSTDDHGVVKFGGIPPGRYVASVHPDDAPAVHSEEFQATVGRETRTRLQVLPGVDVHVTATGPDGAAVKIAAAWLKDARGRPVSSFSAAASEEGATPKTLLHATRGDLKLAVQAEGFQKAEVDIAVGEKPIEIAVKLEKSPTPEKPR